MKKKIFEAFVIRILLVLSTVTTLYASSSMEERMDTSLEDYKYEFMGKIQAETFTKEDFEAMVQKVSSYSTVFIDPLPGIALLHYVESFNPEVHHHGSDDDFNALKKFVAVLKSQELKEHTLEHYSENVHFFIKGILRDLTHRLY